jgi:hypothetical protein
MRSFTEFYAFFGFEDYPFGVFTAESEKDKLKDLFVEPSSYGPILDTFGKRSTVVVCGERGTGKTALILEIERRVLDDRILVRVDDFAALQKSHTGSQLYKFLLDALAQRLLLFVANQPKRSRRLNADEKIVLSYLMKFHVNQLSKQRLAEKVRAIYFPFYKKAASWLYDIFRPSGNVVAAAAVDGVSELICKSLGIPVQPPSTTVREYFPKMNPELLDDIQEQEANLALLTKVADLAKNAGAVKGVLFLIDKVDEDPKLEGDAEEIADFLEVLLKDLKLLLHTDIQFVISSWTIPVEYLKGRGVRLQKLSTEYVTWDKANLEEVLNKRVQTFSHSKVLEYKTLFDSDVTTNDFDELFRLANKNPRDLWHLFDGIMRAQFSSDSDAIKISKTAMLVAIEKFVRTFNFYEYYPRNAGARANSMDIYSYIAHLQKLDKSTFTKNELNTVAGTGSSTVNYVSAMKNMGLIEDTHEKGANSAIVYAIRDPKVVYAMKHSFQIEKT